MNWSPQAGLRSMCKKPGGARTGRISRQDGANRARGLCFTSWTPTRPRADLWEPSFVSDPLLWNKLGQVQGAFR